MRGVTLIDALLLIALVGTLAAGNGLLMSRLAVAAAQTGQELQMLQAAKGLMTEIMAMPMTYCDRDDLNVTTAQQALLGATGCATLIDSIGPELGETRLGPLRFDHVSDWAGYVMPGLGCAGICDSTGTLVAAGALSGCSARVTVSPQAWGGVPALDVRGQAQVLRVRVTLVCPGRADISLESLRLRDAPNRT